MGNGRGGRGRAVGNGRGGRGLVVDNGGGRVVLWLTVTENWPETGLYLIVYIILCIVLLSQCILVVSWPDVTHRPYTSCCNLIFTFITSVYLVSHVSTPESTS